MKYELHHNLEERQYEFHIANVVAKIVYEEEDKGIIKLTHTLVPEQLKGLGIASALARQVFASLEEEGLKVISTCSFIDSYIAKHPEWQRILASS